MPGHYGDKKNGNGKSKKGGKGSPWMSHLMKTFKEGKKKNKDYAYSQAMKDAKKTYKK